MECVCALCRFCRDEALVCVINKDLGYKFKQVMIGRRHLSAADFGSKCDGSEHGDGYRTILLWQSEKSLRICRHRSEMSLKIWHNGLHNELHCTLNGSHF
jgi:hypothetical protein